MRGLLNVKGRLIVVVVLDRSQDRNHEAEED